MMPTQTIRIIDTISEVANLDFTLGGRYESPFLRAEWLVPWCEHYLTENDRILVLVSEDERGVCAMAPFFIRDQWMRGRAIQFLGSGEVCSDYMTLPCAAGDRAKFIESVVVYLIDTVDQWDYIDLDGVTSDDETITAFLAALREAGCVVNERPAESCWRLNLPEDMDQYFASRSKNHRKKMRRKIKLFESGKVKAFEVDDRASLEQGYEVLKRLHQKRWELQGKPGCFSSQKFDDFLFDAANRLLGGALRLVWFEAEGVPVAAEFATKTSQGVFAFQGGVSPDHMDLDPGQLANIWHISKAIEEGKQYIDFLRGDEPYKRLLHAEPVACRRCEIAAPKTGSKIRQSIVMAGRSMKNVMLQHQNIS